MKILQVLPHFSKGGAEKVVVELSNSLVYSGHEVAVLSAYPVDPNLNQKFLDNQIQLHFVLSKNKNKLSHYLKLPYWIIRNWKTLKSYDVIHCHLTYGLIFGFLVWILQKIDSEKKIVLIGTCHVVGVGVGTFPRVLNERLSYFFDYFVLMAQDAKWRHFISRQKKKNVLLIANGISSNLPKSNSHLGSKSEIWRIGTISRLEAERKPWLFLETFAHTQKLTHEKVEFWLGGEGPERRSLEIQAEDLGLTRSLTMPGLVLNPTEFLKTIDIYISLNVEEITGIAGLEAVFSGIPVVGIQLSQSYVNGSDDWIWSNQDPKSVAQKIVDCIKNQVELSNIAETQYKIASRIFSVERMRDEYLVLYGDAQ